MATRVEIITVPDLLSAIKDCEEVRVRVRFGVSERWVKLSKKSALDVVDGLPLDATPHGFEMGTGAFADLDDTILYMG